MNKNFKVFQIHGLSGLLLLMFVSIGLFIGFILFPVWVVMIGWNELVGNVLQGPVINYMQASLLWAIVLISLYITFKNSVSIKIQTSDEIIKDEEIKELIHEVEEKASEE